MSTYSNPNNGQNTNSKGQSPISFIDGEENQLTIEPSRENAGPLMHRQYMKAHDIYKKILGLDDQYEHKQKRDQNPTHDTMQKDTLQNDNNTNNIIAFCGDRGSGKTSCMESFKAQLKCYDKKVLILETIDPSFFDENHNILQLILGQIYKSIQRHYENPNFSNSMEFNYSERVLIELNKAISYLKYLAKPNETPNHHDGMEELEYLAAGIHLKETISCVITEFLKFTDKDRLIISIDDIDLNTSEAYIMAEHIRKYLNVKKCVILLSVNVDQLIDVIKNKMECNSALKTESYNMAVKYITKLMPLGNRINMPVLENYCNLELHYKLKEQTYIFHSVKEAVTLLIFWKTGYLFYNSKGSSSLIVPRSLRQLRQLLHLLAPLKDIYYNDKDNNKEITKKIPLHDFRENQLVFKTYFFGTWTKIFDKSYRSFIKTILQNTHLLTINKTIISILTTIGKLNEVDEFKNICNTAAYAYNISLGDVMRVIEYMSRDESDIQLQHFLFFIRSYYSIILYDAYDDKIESLSYDQEETIDNKREIYKSDPVFNSINVLQQIVNGQYFSYNPNYYLAPHIITEDEHEDTDFKIRGIRLSNKWNSRDKRIINGNAIFEELNSIINKDINDNDEGLDERDKFYFNILEYFILAISRGVRLKNANAKWAKDRESSDPIHLSLGGTRSHLVFDVLAPFFNILNLRTTYNRFDIAALKHVKGENNKTGMSLYDYAYSRNWTLLYKILDRNGDTTKDIDNEHKFLKTSIIRNAEILTALEELLKALRSKPRVKKDHMHIADFYKDIKNSKMIIYPNNSSQYTSLLSFAFLDPIITTLKNCDNEKYFIIESEDLRVNYFYHIFYSPLSFQLDNITPEGIFAKDKYKHSRIMFLLKEYFPEVYKKKKLKEWEIIFPKNKEIRGTDIVAIIEKLM